MPQPQPYLTTCKTKIDGRQAIQKILEQCKHTQIMRVSSLATVSHVQQVPQASALGVLVKPFNSNKVKFNSNKVKQVIRQCMKKLKTD